MNIGKLIKQKRKELRLSQKKLAKKANISTITLYRYETGQREPSIKNLSKIANALNTNIETFISSNNSSSKLD